MYQLAGRMEPPFVESVYSQGTYLLRCRPAKVAPVTNLNAMRICGVIFAVVLGSSVIPAKAQTDEHPSHIPTQQAPNSPYGTDWAKPSGTTGSHIYNDPRLRDPNSANKTQRNKTCPAPTLYDPASGSCR